MTAHGNGVSDPALMQMTPVVSVAMLTYDHSAFIAEAIEGVAMHKVEFPIELVIGVDQSAENALEIIPGYPYATVFLPDTEWVAAQVIVLPRELPGRMRRSRWSAGAFEHERVRRIRSAPLLQPKRRFKDA
jgi:hypothetical protein